MIHQCNVQCHSMDTKTADLIGIDDGTKWMPFLFHMSIVEAAKLSSDDDDSVSFNCTTILTNGGDAYVIDTPYKEFFKKFIEFNTVYVDGKKPPSPGNDYDLDL